jgi:carbamoyl-phosphate synthase small subunit
MSYKKRKKALLLLADGTKFFGKAVASDGTRFGEICFNTGMTGYQEIFYGPFLFWTIDGYNQFAYRELWCASR